MAKRPNQRQPQNQRQPAQNQPEWRKKMEAEKNTAPAAFDTAAPAPSPAEVAAPPPGASIPDIGAIVQAELQKALARLDIPAAAAPATPSAAVAASTLRPDADPNFVEGPGQVREPFEVLLLQRHADWLRNTARMNGMAPQHLLEVLVRRAWAADPTKGGTILVALPDEKGQVAATAPRQR
jgi:hypothetical protein